MASPRAKTAVLALQRTMNPHLDNGKELQGLIVYYRVSTLRNLCTSSVGINCFRIRGDHALRPATEQRTQSDGRTTWQRAQREASD